MHRLYQPKRKTPLLNEQRSLLFNVLQIMVHPQGMLENHETIIQPNVIPDGNQSNPVGILVR